jgi:solute carrier family 25 phosphate transporter 23/24/25/41
MTDATKTNRFHINTTEKTMISGGFAGSVAKTITAPLSRLTILYQVGPVLACASGTSKLNISAGDSLWTTSKNIFKHEGALAFWKGNFTSVLHRFPYSAVNFYSYEVSRAFLCGTFNTKDTPLIRFVCGGFSGLSACFACYPLELVRTRMTVMNSFTSAKSLADNAASEIANAPKSRLYQSKIYKV